jgi:septal ring factor EnvC (AmiA/AmiB activator)
MCVWRDHRRHRHFLLAVTILLATPVSADTDTTDAELRQLRTRIEGLQKNLEQTRDQRDAARNALRPIEQRIGRQVNQLRTTKVQLRKASGQLAQLKSQRQATRSGLARQRAVLGKHARAAYVLGRQDYLKLLLNQQDPAAISRMMTYYRYFTEARAGRIDRLQRELAQLSRLEGRVRQRASTLAAIEARREHETAALKKSRQTRATLVASLNRELRSQGQEIARLKRNERRLENLLVDLPESLPEAGIGGSFRRQRGRLPLPVRGKVTARFGTRRPHGDLLWKGIFLATGRGREVKSVYGGRVVFADWLPGYGLLLILEHGDGYMTLYGNNESLFSRTGDRVKAGQVIAFTGNTGNIARTGLYFEVRHQGKPRDPLRWCRRG